VQAGGSGLRGPAEAAAEVLLVVGVLRVGGVGEVTVGRRGLGLRLRLRLGWWRRRLGLSLRGLRGLGLGLGLLHGPGPVKLRVAPGVESVLLAAQSRAHPHAQHWGLRQRVERLLLYGVATPAGETRALVVARHTQGSLSEVPLPSLATASAELIQPVHNLPKPPINTA